MGGKGLTVTLCVCVCVCGDIVSLFMCEYLCMDLCVCVCVCPIKQRPMCIECVVVVRIRTPDISWLYV